jgi:small subunit ribosomal protein S17
METTRNTRRERIGTVVSNSMEKSIVISVKQKVKHPIYGKFVNKTSKFMAHDEENTCKVGDLVKISETRPLSKKKRWRLVEIIERAK